MRVIDVARQLHVSGDWIRCLERKGLIPQAQRDVNGHRRYTDDDLARLRTLLFTARDAGDGPTTRMPESAAADER
jgi:DNA-binding transcriptional MerR regulator